MEHVLFWFFDRIIAARPPQQRRSPFVSFCFNNELDGDLSETINAEFFLPHEDVVDDPHLQTNSPTVHSTSWSGRRVLAKLPDCPQHFLVREDEEAVDVEGHALFRHQLFDEGAGFPFGSQDGVGDLCDGVGGRQSALHGDLPLSRRRGPPEIRIEEEIVHHVFQCVRELLGVLEFSGSHALQRKLRMLLDERVLLVSNRRCGSEMREYVGRSDQPRPHLGSIGKTLSNRFSFYSVFTERVPPNLLTRIPEEIHSTVKNAHAHL